MQLYVILLAFGIYEKDEKLEKLNEDSSNKINLQKIQFKKIRLNKIHFKKIHLKKIVLNKIRHNPNGPDFIEYLLS